MIKEFDGSLKMAEELLLIDSESFKDIADSCDVLCEKIILIKYLYIMMRRFQ